MLRLTGLAGVPAGYGPSVVTVGKFNGIHLGHLEMIRLTRELAAEKGAASVLLTFDRHPAALLLIVLTAWVGLAQPASAQTYPDRPLRVVNGFAAGGGSGQASGSCSCGRQQCRACGGASRQTLRSALGQRLTCTTRCRSV